MSVSKSLSWDGSHLGSYKNIITWTWSKCGNDYYGLLLPHGLIYCIGIMTKSVFPCIIEDIKPLFNINKRGIHRIIIDDRDYIIYDVPVLDTIDKNLNKVIREVVWETSLKELDTTHQLRKNKEFRHNVQKLLVFCEIMGLDNVSESTIRIRCSKSTNDYIPINTNETETVILKEEIYDGNIISKTLFNKWFDDNILINDIVKDMVGFYTKKAVYIKEGCTLPNYIYKTNNLETNNLHIITSNLRSVIHNIIKKYDSQYVWYTNFIITRLSRYLLIYV